MLIKPLTHNEVKNARATGKDYSLHDGFGLLLYVSKAGGKTWRFRYSHPDTKKRQTLTIGRYPEFTLAEAREARDEARRLVARGIDPNEDRRKKRDERIRRNSQTFAAVASDWLVVAESGSRRKNTMASIRRTLFVYLIPSVGSVSVHDLMADNFIAAVKKYASTPSMLNSIILKANMVMDYAVNSGIIRFNPLTNVHKAFPKVRSKPVASLDVESLPAFLDYWLQVGLHPSTKNALLFMILTMVRPVEACDARWQEIDSEKKLWVIPAERMKGAREHTVPLSDQAVELLNEMRKIKQSEYIFYGAYCVNKPISREAILQAIKRSPFAGALTPHGFRSMWSTLLNEEGFNPDVIEAALAHRGKDTVRAVYNRTNYIEQRVIMMQWVGDFYDSAKAGHITRGDGKRGLRLINER